LAMAVSSLGVSAVIDGTDHKLILRDLNSLSANPATLTNIQACLNEFSGSCTSDGQPSVLTFSQDGSKLFIADIDPDHVNDGSIRVLDVGSLASPLPSPVTLVSQGIAGASAAFTPSGLLQIGSTLYISDRANRVIYSVDVGTFGPKSLSLYAGGLNSPGAEDVTTNPGNLTNARFYAPEGLSSFVDSNLGHTQVLVADAGSNSIRIIDPHQNTTATLGAPYGLGGDGLNHPTMAVMGQDGMVYIADQENSVIKRYDPARSYLSIIAGSSLHMEHRDGYAEEAFFSRPTSLIPTKGGFWVLDLSSHPSLLNGGIRKLMPFAPCPYESDGSNERPSKTPFAAGGLCALTVALFSPASLYDSLILELGIESGGDFGWFQNILAIPSSVPSGGMVSSPSGLTYYQGNPNPLELGPSLLGSGNYFGLQKFSILQARVSSSEESKVLTQFPDSSERLVLNNPVGTNPPTISVRRTLNDKPITEVDVVIEGVNSANEPGVQRLKIKLIPSSDPSKP